MLPNSSITQPHFDLDYYAHCTNIIQNCDKIFAYCSCLFIVFAKNTCSKEPKKGKKHNINFIIFQNLSC